MSYLRRVEKQREGNRQVELRRRAAEAKRGKRSKKNEEGGSEVWKHQHHEAIRTENRGWACCNCGAVLKEATDGPGGFPLHKVGECQKKKKKTCWMCAGIDLGGLQCPNCTNE